VQDMQRTRNPRAKNWAIMRMERHGIHALKIGQLCEWKGQHEKEYHQWQDKVDNRFKDLDKRFGDLKNWAIGNLVALCFLLIGVITVLVRMK